MSVEYGEALQLCGDVAAAREVLLGAAREAAAAGRAGDLARAALALGGGLAGFEVPLQDEEQADLLRKADAALPPDETALRAAVRGRLSLALAGSAPEAERVALAQDAVRMAGAAGDRQIESAVLAAYCDAIAGPDYVRERTAAATRMLSLASDPPEASLQPAGHLLLARRLLLVALLEQGDLPGRRSRRPRTSGWPAGLGIPRYGWLPEIWRGMRALLDGDPDRALEHAAAAEGIGRRAHSFNAELMAFTARMQAHLDRGTASQYAGDVETLLTAVGPDIPAMYLRRAGPAAARRRRRGQARAVLRAFLAGPAQTMPKDAEWLECALGDGRHRDQPGRPGGRGRLAAELAPYEALWAVDGIGGAVFGTVAEQLGRLAAYLGRPGEASRYLAAARDRYERRAPPRCVARLDALSGPPAAAHRQPTRLAAPRRRPVWLVGVARPPQYRAGLERHAGPRRPARPAGPAGAGASSWSRPRAARRQRPPQQAVSARFWTPPRAAPTSSGSPTWKTNWPRPRRTPTSAGWSGCAPSGRCSPPSSRARSAWAAGPGSPATRPSAPARRSRCASGRRSATIAAQDDALARHLRNTDPHRPAVQLPAGRKAVSWRT